MVNEYQLLLKKITPSKFEYVFDSQTEDPDCKSIQTITKHIIRSGHTYANYLNQKSSLEWIDYEKVCISPEDGINQLNTMIQFSLNALFLVDEFSIEKIENLKFHTRWNVTYDFEQLMEHAIVHILRHRRQVEHFLIK